MKYLVAMLYWCLLSFVFMISSASFFAWWYVFVFLGVYFILVVCSIPEAIRKDKRMKGGLK